jgi:hypothetical protein
MENICKYSILAPLIPPEFLSNIIDVVVNYFRYLRCLFYPICDTSAADAVIPIVDKTSVINIPCNLGTKVAGNSCRNLPVVAKGWDIRGGRTRKTRERRSRALVRRLVSTDHHCRAAHLSTLAARTRTYHARVHIPGLPPCVEHFASVRHKCGCEE